jgi:lipoate-protein ligase A
MAVDDVLLRTADKRSKPLLRLYAWDPQADSIGYFQKYPADLAGTVVVVRRPTGGGLVHHGDNVDTTYTVVVPAGHALHQMTTADAYCAIHRAVAAALQTQAELAEKPVNSPRGNYECFQNPVHGDVVAGNQKLAGAAQRRSRTGMLHQGSIAARVPAEALLEAFRRAFACEFEPYDLSAEERAMANWLAEGKYNNDKWTRRL